MMLLCRNSCKVKNCFLVKPFVASLVFLRWYAADIFVMTALHRLVCSVQLLL